MGMLNQNLSSKEHGNEIELNLDVNSFHRDKRKDAAELTNTTNALRPRRAGKLFLEWLLVLLGQKVTSQGKEKEQRFFLPADDKRTS